MTATTVDALQNSSFDTGNIKIDVSTANSGISAGSEYLELMQNAALNGGKQLVVFNNFCADMQDSVMQIMAGIYLHKLEPKYNEITDEYGYFLEAMVDHDKWILEIVTKNLTSTAPTTQEIQKQTVLASINLFKNSKEAHSVSLYFEYMGELSALTIDPAKISVEALLIGLKKASIESSKTGKSMQEVLSVGNKALTESVETLVKKAIKVGSKIAKVIAKSPGWTDVVWLIYFIVKTVISIISQNTIWKLSLLNKTNLDLVWKEDVNKGQLLEAPYDPITGQLNRLVPKNGIDNSSTVDSIYYNDTTLTFAHLDALTGVNGSVLLKLQAEENVKVLEYKLEFNFPFSGTNTVEVKEQNNQLVIQSQGSGQLAWQLKDDKNNIKILYSISKEKSGNDSIRTINNGEEGHNYTSVIEIAHIA
jgi:hypothetical protein